MNRLSKPLSICGVAALCFGVALPVYAQNVLDEIVVTAQKREQSIQDVGIAISAFTGDQMRTLGVEDSFDIARFTPGVNISGNLAGQNTQFTIRDRCTRLLSDLQPGRKMDRLLRPRI